MRYCQNARGLRKTVTLVFFFCTFGDLLLFILVESLRVLKILYTFVNALILKRIGL